MIAWEIVRHAVAIAGTVTDHQTGKSIGGARVQITDAPSAFADWLALRAMQHEDRWATMEERPDRLRTAVDGHFHFVDLPAGQYTLTVSLPGSSSRYGESQVDVTVSTDAEGNVIMAAADVSLPPTTLKGEITDQVSGDPVAMAEVRVKGSGERTFSGGDGRYLLAGLEATDQLERTVLVTAQGYQPGSQTVLLDQAGTEQTLDFTLEV